MPRQAGSLARSPFGVKPPSGAPPSADCGSPLPFHRPRPPGCGSERRHDSVMVMRDASAKPRRDYSAPCVLLRSGGHTTTNYMARSWSRSRWFSRRWSPRWSLRPVASWRSPRSVRSPARSRRRPTARVACRHACRCSNEASLPCGSSPTARSASVTFQRCRYSTVCPTARSQARPPLTVGGRWPSSRDHAGATAVLRSR